MQESFEIKSSTGFYSVELGKGLIKRTQSDHPDGIYLIDACIRSSLDIESERLISIQVSEEAKSLERMAEVIVSLKQLGANRSSHLVALGGGVIQDIGTFTSSIYMRGIKWTYMPTTLLGMVDSCIGGKSSINVGGYKNLVGNFYPPEAILIDPHFVESLNDEQIVGGLFEAVKICFARGEETFSDYLNEQPDLSRNPEKIQSIASLTLRTKKWFIEIDEFDQNERLLLNFGHTFGHAIEAGTHFGVSHGIAVGIGMMVAVTFSQSLNLLNPKGNSRAEKLRNHIQSMLDLLCESDLEPKEIRLNRILEKFEMDKKHQTNFYRMVCPQGEGDLALISQTKDHQQRENIKSAYTKVFEKLGWKVS